MLNNLSILSWNINSIRARIELLCDIIQKYNPDIILLQETKVLDEAFPVQVFEDSHYNIAMFGQKSYNGVAIFSKSPIENLEYCPFSNEARLISGFTCGINVSSVYVINGREINAPQYGEKLAFLDNLTELFRTKSREKTIIGGDFNITTDDFDVYDPKKWSNKITCSEQEREQIKKFKLAGYDDEFRKFNDNNTYTWWDYRHNSVDKNHGLRIDYIFTSKKLTKNLKSIEVLKNIREVDKTSDHAPLLCTLRSDES